MAYGKWVIVAGGWMLGTGGWLQGHYWSLVMAYGKW